MAAMSVKGPYVNNSEEAKALACRNALEFSIDVGFSELVIEGDNINIMKAISSSTANHSLLGHVFEDVQCFVCGLQFASISCIKEGGGEYGNTCLSMIC